MDQPAAALISFIDMPLAFAFDVAADRVECEENNLIFIPASFSTAFTHLDTVDTVTPLWGVTRLMNSFFVSPRIGVVVLI